MVTLADLAAVPGRLIRHGEGMALANLAADASAPIVEVGSYKGLSTCYLALGGTVPVHAVDLWDLGGQKHSTKYAQRAVYDAFLAQTAGLDVTAHKGASTDVAATWDQPIGLLHIDGLHTYGGVWSDLRAWEPHLTPEATVAFHDYCPDFPGVIRAVDEWAGSDRIVHRLDRLAWVHL